eukprot:gene14644-biopygen18651
MGPEVGPAFQRRSRDTVPFLGVRLAETGSRHVDSKGMHVFLVHFDRGSQTWDCRPSRREPPSRSEPPHARAPGAQMIRMASGSSLAFQRLSRYTLPFILSVRLASGDLNFEN